MNETSKHGKKDDILYAIPAGFKTIDELAKILAEGDVSRRKEELKAWYIKNEFPNSPPDRQEIMFAKSKNYQKYLSEIEEIDKAMPQNTVALRESLLLYFNRLTERERATLEERMKIVGDKAQEDEKIRKENMQYLADAKAREAEVTEKGRRYDAELARVNDYDVKLKARSEELGILELNLERKTNELSGMRKDLKDREAAVIKQEHEYGQAAKEISDALTYARMLKTVVGPKIEGFHTMLDEMATYFQNALKKLPNTQVPPTASPPK